MALDTEEVLRIYTQVALGTAKADYQWPLSEEADAFWDRLEREVAGAKAQGLILEMPEIEVPDIPPWTAQAPEAKQPREPSS